MNVNTLLKCKQKGLWRLDQYRSSYIAKADRYKQAQRAFSTTHARAKVLRNTGWIRNVPHAFHTPLIHRLVIQAVDTIENRIHLVFKVQVATQHKRLRAQHRYGGNVYPEKLALLELDRHPLKFGYRPRTKTLIRLLSIYPSRAG